MKNMIGSTAMKAFHQWEKGEQGFLHSLYSTGWLPVYRFEIVEIKIRVANVPCTFKTLKYLHF